VCKNGKCEELAGIGTRKLGMLDARLILIAYLFLREG